MRKQIRQYLQRSLCGILSAAMILTGSSISGMTVLAAQPDAEDAVLTNEPDDGAEVTPSEENEDAVQSPETDDGTADGSDDGAGNEDPDQSTAEGDETLSGDEEGSDGEDVTEGQDVEKDETKDDGTEEDDPEPVPDEDVKVTATSEKTYTDQSVTLNYYAGTLAEGEEVGFYKWGTSISVDTDTNPLLSWKVYTNNEDVYEMKAVDGQAGWYHITFKATETLTLDETGACTNSLGGFNVVRSSDKQNAEFICDAWNYSEIYLGLLEGEITAVKDKKGYADIAGAGTGTDTNPGEYTEQEVNLNYYVGEVETDETVGFYYWTDTGGAIVIDTETNPLLSWGGWGDASKNPVYEMKAVDGHTGWYHITLKVTDKLTLDNGTCTGSLTGFHVIRSTKSGKDDSSEIECSGYVKPEIYTGLLDGSITAVKGGKGYATIDDAEAAGTEALAELVAEAKKLKEEDYKPEGWKTFSKALTDAEAVLAKDNPTSDEIEEAYDNLDKAMKALVSNSVVDAEINVKPVALADDFILGADISSYWALKQSGTVFKDENGKELSAAEFFQYLHDGGTNWIRIRVWNDPYDGEGHGYGGGNNDLEKAKIMGKLATDAGMRVLIDFHYSDFWADPGKQQAPKAWANMSVDEKAEAVYQYTKNSLGDLKAAGVDVGMVQIGNETTQGISGVFYGSDGWEAAAKIYSAGSKAVREFDANCLVAVHFTNPEKTANMLNLAKSLDDQKVDYDVFATSYYPFWHGTTENLTSVLSNVAKTYDKKVMVAETSWATTLEDQDGHGNTVRKGNNDTGQPYAFSVQGQADEIRAVVEAANNVNSVDGAAGSSIGVFYWEAAWLSPYYAYNEDGTLNDELYEKNKALWEEHGSGWAASYGGSYDPNDAGQWYGGSAVDNQAWFGFDGRALATAKVYSYIRTGAVAEKAVSDVVNPSVTINAGETVGYPEKVTVNFNDGTSAEYAVTWNAEDQAKVDTAIPGDYTVQGSVTCDYTLSDGSTATATKDVTLTITVKPVTVPEFVNPGFEDGDMSAWVITGEGTARKDEDPRSGSYGVHFYNGSAVTSTVMQTIRNLAAGTYTFGGYIQGDGTTANAVVKVYDSEGTLKDTRTASAATAGWRAWQNPEITDIAVGKGDYLEVGMEINAVAGGWGTIDDFYLYATSITTVQEGLRAEWTDEWAELLGSDNTITYTGKAIKPAVKVYDGETLLTNKNYSVSYKNNTKTGEASVVITGKGNYTGSCTKSFKIDYVDLEKDADVSIADLYAAASKNGNQVSVKPVVTWKGKKVNAKLYEVVLPDQSEGAYVKPGTYQVEVKAKEGNGIYKGSRMIKITLADTADNTKILMSGVKVKFNFKSKPWNKDGVTLEANDIELTYKNKKTNEKLTFGDDYTLSYENNDRIGTATVIITGTGTAANEKKYVGQVRKTFKIVGAAIKAADVKLETGTEPIVYNGTAQKPKVTVGELKEGSDYTVQYQNNINAGKKATAIITGINGYSGTVKKTFTIAAHDVNQSDVSIQVEQSAAYEKGGSKPPVEVTFGGRTLVLGTDYTVTYAKNTKVTGEVLAEAKVKGKGNFAKTKTVTFAIAQQSLDKLVATAADQTSAKKWNKVNPVITDLNGKALKKGTDYEKTFTYKLYNTDGTEITDTTATPPAAGMKVQVTATGKNNYKGTVTAEYRIIDSKQSIAKARMKVKEAPIYTGKAIELQKSNIILEIKEGTEWKTLTDDQYEIVGYSNNVNKGKKAKVTIHGLAPYGGTKTFNFEIKAQSVEKMSWTERIASMFEWIFN